MQTVKVYHKSDRKRFMTINLADFDEDKHKLWPGEAARLGRAEAQAEADSVKQAEEGKAAPSEPSFNNIEGYDNKEPEPAPPPAHHAVKSSAHRRR